jgi:hypothetical protein
MKYVELKKNPAVAQKLPQNMFFHFSTDAQLIQKLNCERTPEQRHNQQTTF